MTPQDWGRLKELFDQALDLEAGGREAFLNELDGRDPAIAKELRGLLAEVHSSDLEGASLGLPLDSTAVREFVSSLGASAPEQIGGYRIIRELGRGSSSIVFRARREAGPAGAASGDVAIKVLRFADWDEGRKRQFSTERHILGQLDHPNIARMLDWGVTAVGFPYLVMELVEGTTLDTFRRRESPALGERLALFGQVLEAVAFAHRHSIMHRDLKPANILVTADRKIKLLDFGISKLFEADPDATATLERKFTPAYASPEQILGAATGPATDIYSLGVIVYELVTGQLPYPRQSGKTDELPRAVLEQAPAAPSSVSPEVPRELDAVILRALEKAPANRYATVEEFARLLASPGSTRKPRRHALFRGATAAGLAVAAGWMYLDRAPHRVVPGTPSAVTSVSEFAAYPAVSARNDRIAYASDQDGNGALHIWVQGKRGEAAVKLSSGTADDTDPSFSADGQWVAFHSEREPKGVYVIPAGGGTEEFLAPFGQSPRFSPGAMTVLYWVADPHTRFGSVWRVRLDRKEPFRLGNDFEDAHNPVWTPDGHHVLICGTRHADGGPAESHDFWIVAEDGSPAVKTGAFALLQRNHIDPHLPPLRSTSFVWLDEGILFGGSRGGISGFWVLPISRRTWKATGDPYPFNKADDGEVWRTIHPAVSGGALAFARARADAQIWSLPVDAETAQVRGPREPLTGDSFEHLMPTASADGGKLLFLGLRGDHMTIYSRDAKTGSERALADSVETNRVKVSGDGRYAAWRVMEGRGRFKQAVYRMNLADGKSERVCADCGGPVSLSFDGSLILFENGSAATQIGVLRAATGEKRELIRHAYHPVQSARLSNDGRWVVFELVRGQDARQLFAAPFHESHPVEQKEWAAITPSDGVAESPAWSPAGGWIYYFDRSDGFRCLWARRWDGRAGKADGDPVSIEHFHNARQSPLALEDRDSRYIGLSIARDRIILTLSELESQVWSAEVH